MKQPGRCWLWLAVFSLGSLAHASDTEIRDFDILVGGKPAGQSRVTLIQDDDGSFYMKATAAVKVPGLIPYKFNIEAEEWWKAGKLVALKAISQENKKRTEIVVSSDGKQLNVNANGQLRSASAETWTTSYCKLADPRFHNKEVPILETDTGTAFVGKLTFKAIEKLTIAGKLEDCYHFQVSGTLSSIDLWFDKYHRLVRQEFIESGHPTIVQINAIRR